MEHSKDILDKLFESLASRLQGAFEGSSVNVPSRTCNNRERAVEEFLKAVLPISVEARQGAIIVDALGQQSRDIDIVLLNPWASPVWPYLHGVVPVEGVLCSVLVEILETSNFETLWKQVTSAKRLLKSLKARNYQLDVRRTFRSEVGVWFWKRAFKGSFTKKIFENLTGKSGEIFKKYRNDSRKAAKKNEWVAKQFNEWEDRLEEESFFNFQNAVGSMFPNWFYAHGYERNRRELLVKVQGRFIWDDNKWVTPALDNVAKSTLVCPTPTSWYALRDIEEVVPYEHKDEIPWDENQCWAYAYYSGHGKEDPLRVLATQLAFSTTLYGGESTDYASYMK